MRPLEARPWRARQEDAILDEFGRSTTIPPGIGRVFIQFDSQGERAIRSALGGAGDAVILGARGWAISLSRASISLRKEDEGGIHG